MSIERRGSGTYAVTTPDGEPRAAGSLHEAIWHFGDFATVELQLARPELYFLHAAVLEHRRSAFLLVGESGGGKTTLTWSLLQGDCRLLSDELAPVELEGTRVWPYPRPLHFKRPPPPPLPLPEPAAGAVPYLYADPSGLPLWSIDEALAIETIFFVHYEPTAGQPDLAPMGTADAAIALYRAALNPLAHSGDGLDPAIELARRCRCFDLVSADPVATGERVLGCVTEGLQQGSVEA